MKDLLTPLQIVADVAVPVPAGDLFTYSVPPEMQNLVRTGVRVCVPFRNRETTGYVIAVEPREATRPLKPLAGVLDAEPVLSPEILTLTRQISQYYGCSWGEAIENALPKWVKYGKKAARALKAMEDEPASYTAEHSSFELTPEQHAAFEEIGRGLESASPVPILLHGVTGSGKSELYIRAIRRTLELQRGAICMVPEITLTEQLKRFFARQFGEELEILHSKLSDGERFLAWKRLETGKTRIVLGPRSAVFAPVRRLGLIIIDEEHENSYKQETSPRYHARQVAMWRAQNESALLLMGTATPSMEAVHLSEKGEIRRILLHKRVDDRSMPEVQIVDLKDHQSPKQRIVILSRPLAQRIEANLSQKNGTLLLLNRRGFSTHVHCPGCAHVEECESCHVSLTFHQEDDLLLCHYCNFQRKVSDVCSNCAMPLLRFAGFGTEKVESETARMFPQARIARLDADTIRRKGSHEHILRDFRDQKIDILIGTQMIAKGFDFPHVTLVGVILADVGLMLPDFRSAERTFQLLTQVAGRAGRGTLEGRVIIQTFSPKHPSVAFARTHDYTSFFAHESVERQKHFYPPYARLVNIIIRSKDEKKAYQSARELRDHLKKELSGLSAEEQTGLQLIGPAPLPFYKLRGHFRWHLMLKLSTDFASLPLIHREAARLKKPSAVQIAVDVDPLNIL